LARYKAGAEKARLTRPGFFLILAASAADGWQQGIQHGFKAGVRARNSKPFARSLIRFSNFSGVLSSLDTVPNNLDLMVGEQDCRELKADSLIALQEEIARQVAARLGSLYGIILPHSALIVLAAKIEGMIQLMIL
jgi:hypothetical protein